MTASEVVRFPAHGVPQHYSLSPPPANVDAEQVVLGAILAFRDKATFLLDRLRPEYFSEPLHQRILEVALALAAEGKPVSPISVRPFIDAEFVIEGVTPQLYLARMCAEACTLDVAIGCAEILRDFATRRALTEFAHGLLERCRAVRPDDPPDKMVLGAIEHLYGLAAPAQSATRREAGVAAESLLEYGRQRRAGEIHDQGVTTGFPALDGITGGYEPGTLWIVGARPGMGKTIFAVTSANKVARKGIGVLTISLEVPERQLVARHLADLSYSRQRPITYAQIMRGELDDSELWMVDDARKRLDEMPLVFDCSSSLVLGEVRSRVRIERMRAERAGLRLGVVFIDYLNFLKASDRYKGQRVQEIGELSLGLKQIAKEENTCIVLLCQLNRGLEGREDKRPGLADIRDSGNLEQDADVVAFLHRDAYHIGKSAAYRSGDGEAVARYLEVKHKSEVIIGKNRAGAEGIVHLFCDVASSHMAAQSEIW